MTSYSSYNLELGKEASDYLDFLNFDQYSDDLHDAELDDTNKKGKECLTNLTTNNFFEPYISDNNNQLDVESKVTPELNVERFPTSSTPKYDTLNNINVEPSPAPNTYSNHTNNEKIRLRVALSDKNRVFIRILLFVLVHPLYDIRLRRIHNMYSNSSKNYYYYYNNNKSASSSSNPSFPILQHLQPGSQRVCPDTSSSATSP